MIRSLYSGVSGLKNHQLRMDVVGNNISNVNTIGYKAGTANFQDALSQTIRSGGDGRNPAQIGTGMGIGSVANNFTQGATQYTGRTLDLAIDGNGFFVVHDDETNTDYYTRAGAFFLDEDGYLVDSNGFRVQSSTGDIQVTNGPVSDINISSDGTITGTNNDGDDLTFAAGGNIIELVTFPNPEGLIKVGSNIYQSEAENPASTSGDPADDTVSTIESGYLEMSNVDLTDEFANMIVTQRGYQANSRIITVSDTMLEELINLKR